MWKTTDTETRGFGVRMRQGMHSFCFGAKPTIIHLTLTPKVGNLLYSPLPFTHSLTHPQRDLVFRFTPPRRTALRAATQFANDQGWEAPPTHLANRTSKLCDDRLRLGENLRELVCRVIIRCHTTLEPPPPTSACPHLQTDEWPVSGDVRRPGLDTRYWRSWYSGTGPLGGFSLRRARRLCHWQVRSRVFGILGSGM